MVSNRIMNTTEGCKSCLPLFNHRGNKMGDILLFLLFVETKKCDKSIWDNTWLESIYISSSESKRALSAIE